MFFQLLIQMDIITVKVEPEVSTIFEFIYPDANIPRVKSRMSSTTIMGKGWRVNYYWGIVK